MNRTREIAYLSLVRLEKEKRYSNIETDTMIKKYGLEGPDRSLYSRLVYGVIEKMIPLDYIAESFFARKGAKTDISTKTIVRLGIYQIIYLDKVPDYAAVNESVELAKKYSKGTASFVNALLHTVIRKKDNISFPDICTEYGIGRWIYESFVNDYSEETAKKIIKSFKEGDLSLRVNTLKITADKLPLEIEVPTKRSAIAKDEIILAEKLPVSDFAPLEDGLCFIESEPSRLAVEILEPDDSGMTVIDTCAAPGGKSFSSAIDMKNKGRVISLDLHENKLSLIKNGAKKLGIDIIETRAHDGRESAPDLISSADRVICDVPCSGLGVIGGKPDLRHKRYEDVIPLADTQYSILSASAKYLKKGGILVYSTCTLRKAENEEIVKRFLENNPGFEYYDFISPDGKKTNDLTIFPFDYGTDGFFISRIRRKD